MDLNNKIPILVTGIHRSGTTWVGKMLAIDPAIAYISEPLNVLHRRGVLRVPISHWYPYICDDNQFEFLDSLEDLLAYKYNTWLEIKSLRSLKDFLRMLRDWRTFRTGKREHQKPLLKDPFAVFSAEWFARNFKSRVVIIVRHPAAVVSSFLRLNWDFNFSDLLGQPLLMRDWLEPYRKDMEEISGDSADILVQGSLLWRMVYRVVAALRERHPEFIILRHEDLSMDPINGYKGLYTTLGLRYSESVREEINKSSSGENPSELPVKAIHSVRVDSQANIKNWQRRLSSLEIERIYELTMDVSPEYYSEGDWE